MKVLYLTEKLVYIVIKIVDDYLEMINQTIN